MGAKLEWRGPMPATLAWFCAPRLCIGISRCDRLCCDAKALWRPLLGSAWPDRAQRQPQPRGKLHADLCHMIRGDYLVLCGDSLGALCGTARVALPQLRPIFSTAHCAVLADGQLPAALMSEAKGAILGQLHGPDAHAFGPSPARSQAFPGWEAVTRDNWGDFVVVEAASDGAVVVARSAMGRLPCYHVEWDGVLIFSNAVRMIEKLGLALEVDEDAVLRHLLNINARTRATCLVGLFELEAGYRLEKPRDVQPVVRAFWDPWRFAGRAGEKQDVSQAPRYLQERIVEVTRKMTLGRHLLLGDRKSGSAGMPRPISYAVFCLKKKKLFRRGR
eukprot:TRINITY_DN2335_c0_g1_i14.p1 TRINITY_DN2335_c0_g1~~TRINITY_DN2335_c0_g1_i14.p1  ORF type:complete len:332 (+),score=32.28 TRINITY_DN2335_c0_g1_i14:582-1577(+)